MKILPILLLVSLLLLIPFVSASTAQIGWINTTYGAICVTAVDTNVDGTMIMVGLGNGTILVYQMNINTSDNTANAVQLLVYSTNSSGSVPKKAIKKIVADTNGNFAWISEANETGYISSAQAIASHIHGTNTNITDVEIRGNMYAISELNPPRIRIFNSDGTLYAQNTTFGTATKWVNIGYDPNNEWLVSANESSNRVYFWNISSWTGWTDFNPTYTASKNVSQQLVDTFPYRMTLNLTPLTGNKGIFFQNTSTVTQPTKINNSYYQYNSAYDGQYFYWTINNNLSNTPQSSILNMSIINGSGINTNYSVMFGPGQQNYTIYFGNPSYTYSYLEQDNHYTLTSGGDTILIWNNTGTFSWRVPTGLTSVQYLVVAGGGSAQGNGVGGTGGGLG